MMNAEISNEPEEGKRVWSLQEISGVNPDTKSRIWVPANTGGTIDHTRTTGPLGTGKALIVVRWDSLQTTESGYANLVCIHPFQTLDELLDAALRAYRAEYVLDTTGQLEGFRIEVQPDDNSLETLAFTKDQHAFFRDSLIPRLKLGGVMITETVVKRA